MRYSSRIFRFYFGKDSHTCVFAFGLFFLSFIFYFGSLGIGQLFSIKAGFNFDGITVIRMDLFFKTFGFDIKFGYRGIP